MITIDALNVRFGNRAVLDGVTMHLTEGKVHALAGINGTGKTTLLDTLYGFIAPTSGSVTRAGRPLRRRDIAYLESEAFFYDGMTGRDYLDLTARYHPSFDPATCIRLFGLPVDEPVAEWSADMKKKLALAGVLMRRKPVLLLDEPFNGLDIESVHTAQRLILQRSSEGCTVLVTSHILSAVEPVADDLRILDGGRIAAEYEREAFGRAARELEALVRRPYEESFPRK